MSEPVRDFRTIANNLGKAIGRHKRTIKALEEVNETLRNRIERMEKAARSRSARMLQREVEEQERRTAAFHRGSPRKA